MRSRLLFIFFLLSTLCVGCGPKNTDVAVVRTADALLLVSKSVGAAQTLVIEANRQQLIDDELTKEILLVCRDINVAGKEAIAASLRIIQLSPEERIQVLNQLVPVINALDQAMLKIRLIPDEQTRNLVHAALQGVQTTLQAVQLQFITGGVNVTAGGT